MIEQDFILLKCLKKGCPRTKKISKLSNKEIPLNVNEIHSYCPWHEKPGWKEYQEIYFDNVGNKLDSSTFEII